jgi:hypothetical protein
VTLVLLAVGGTIGYALAILVLLGRSRLVSLVRGQARIDKLVLPAPATKAVQQRTRVHSQPYSKVCFSFIMLW